MTGSERIVVGVDGSDNSLLALRWALDEGALRRLPVHAVMSWSVPTSVGMAPAMLLSGSELQDSAVEELDGILRRHGAGPTDRPAESPVTSEVAEGGPAAALLAAAASGASLLVVGSRGHGGFTGLLLGSVSQQCAAHATCPVVIVHAKAAMAD